MLLTGNFHSRKWAGVIPAPYNMLDQNTMPSDLGIGFSDLGNEVSAKFILLFSQK